MKLIFQCIVVAVLVGAVSPEFVSGAETLSKEIIKISNAAELADASRGTGRFAEAPPDTTFVIQDGTYAAPEYNALMWITKGGTAKSPRVFKGESRDGVVIVGRATVEADHVELRNMTFDITNYEVSADKSFNTITVAGAKNVRITDVTCTGNQAKGKMGGHIQPTMLNHRIPENIVIENCVIEKFGRLKHPGGKLDHGIYVSAGRTILIRNNEIRYNAGRGIQLYAHEGGWKRISDIMIVGNRIHHNGRLPYTDGIVIATAGYAPPGSIADVTIRHNIFYKNAHSGIRFNSKATRNILVENNTFYHNGEGTKWGLGIDIDSDGKGKDARIRKNLFVPEYVAVFGVRYAKDMVFEDNLLEGRPGDLPVGKTYRNLLTAPEEGDFTPRDPAHKGYGARIGNEELAH